MRSLTSNDILPIDRFQAVRNAHEKEVIHHKELRRVSLGPNMTLLFENRVTLRWQIHEMCRVENIIQPEAVEHELATYNALLPKRNELSATLLVEYTDPQRRVEMLHKLLGLEKHLFLEVEGYPPVLASFDNEQFNQRRISSVQFLRFRLTEEQLAAFCDLRQHASLMCNHPEYNANEAFSMSSRGALVEDLSQE